MRLFTAHLIALFLVICFLVAILGGHFISAVVCMVALVFGMTVMGCIMWRDIFYG